MTIVGARTALLELVAQDRDRKCAAIHGEASARAQALLRAAHASARATMRTTFAQERGRMMERIDAARAMLATKRRLAEQRRATALLAAGWERLPAALARRWRDPAARAQWVERIAAEAQARLPAGAWRIVHAPDWTDAERDALAARLEVTHTGSTQVADPNVRAGLKIVAGGT